MDAREGVKEGVTVPVKITVSLVVLAGAIWWAATTTATLQNLSDLLKVQEMQRSAEINQLRNEVQQIRQDQKTLDTYNQNLREKLAARGILGK